MANLNTNSRSLLAMATSERVSSVCVATGQNILAVKDSAEWMKQFPDDQAVGKSTAIVSMMQSMLDQVSIEPTDLDAVALTNGPGGFTGLRVGVVAARMLCYAWNLPVIVVNSLEVAADKLRRQCNLGDGKSIWAVTDAQRRQVFAAKMRVCENGELTTVEPQALFERQALVDLLESGDHVTGSGAFAFADLIEKKTGVKLPDPSAAACDAEAVARLADRRFAAEDFDDLLTIEPIYFRPSAAEEVRLAKEDAK